MFVKIYDRKKEMLFNLKRNEINFRIETISLEDNIVQVW
jgi:hypothetical protein